MAPWKKLNPSIDVNIIPVDQGSLLSQQEWRVCQEIAKGLTAKEAARKLSVSHRTVEHYLRTLKISYG